MKTLITTAIVAASLALIGTAAIAATAQPHKTVQIHKPVRAVHVAHARPAAHYAARYRGPRNQLGFDVGLFIQGMLGGPLPPQYAQIVQNAMRESASHRSSGSYESSGSYDFSPSSPTVDVDNSQSQAAIDASDQAIQQEDQSLQDLDASVAAAEQQNDAANAAALQTDINAGM